MSMGLVPAESASSKRALGAVAALPMQEAGAASVAVEAPVPAGVADGRMELPLDELSFHRLASTDDIAQILDLRGEIQLSASALADPSFHTREKKETSTASSALSGTAGRRSGPSG